MFIFFLLNTFTIFFTFSADNDITFEQKLNEFKLQSGWEDISEENLLNHEAHIIEQKTLINVLDDYVKMMKHISKTSNSKALKRIKTPFQEFNFTLTPRKLPYTVELDQIINPIYKLAYNSIHTFNAFDPSIDVLQCLNTITKTSDSLALKNALVNPLYCDTLRLIFGDINFILQLFLDYHSIDKCSISTEIKKSFLKVLEANHYFLKANHTITFIEIKNSSPIADHFLKMLHDPNKVYTLMQAFFVATLKHTTTLDMKKRLTL